MKATCICFALCTAVFINLNSQCVFACYTYSRSSISFSAFPSSGSNAIPQFLPTIDDGITSPIPLGFNFDYYCGTYSAVLVCSNGFLQFDIGSPPNLAFSNPSQSFPDPTSPNGIVALNMNDFDPNMGGTITYSTIGTPPNRMFVLTYSNVPIWNYNTSLNSGQIVLYETTNVIEIHTDNINTANTNTFTGTQGIESPSGTAGNMVPGRNSSLWQVTVPDAYRWTPVATYSPAAPTGSISGPDTLCTGATGNYTVSTSPGAVSYNWSFPFGWTGSSTTTAITATAGASGALSVTTTYSCGTSAPVLFTVTTKPLPFISIGSVTPGIVCAGKAATISPAGGVNYTIVPGYTQNTNSFVVTPSISTTYSIYGTGANGCEGINHANAAVIVNPSPTVTVNGGSICLGQQFTFIPAGADEYTFSTIFPLVTPSVTGTFTCLVTGKNQNGCYDEAVGELTVHPLPLTSASVNRPFICFKERVIVSASGADTYSWNTGSTAGTFSATPFGSTVFIVNGTNEFGCVSSGSVSVTVDPCLGINNLGYPADDMMIFPNPSEGLFTLTFPAEMNDVVLDVFDSSGKLISSLQIREKSVGLDLRESPGGIYLLRFRGSSGVRKLVVSHVPN